MFTMTIKRPYTISNNAKKKKKNPRGVKNKKTKRKNKEQTTKVRKMEKRKEEVKKKQTTTTTPTKCERREMDGEFEVKKNRKENKSLFSTYLSHRFYPTNPNTED